MLYFLSSLLDLKKMYTLNIIVQVDGIEAAETKIVCCFVCRATSIQRMLLWKFFQRTYNGYFSRKLLGRCLFPRFLDYFSPFIVRLRHHYQHRFWVYGYLYIPTDTREDESTGSSYASASTPSEVLKHFLDRFVQLPHSSYFTDRQCKHLLLTPPRYSNTNGHPHTNKIR